MVLGQFSSGETMDELFQSPDESVLFAQLLEDPMGARLHQGQGSQPLGIGEGELDQRSSPTRPAGEVGLVDTRLSLTATRSCRRVSPVSRSMGRWYQLWFARSTRPGGIAKIMPVRLDASRPG